MMSSFVVFLFFSSFFLCPCGFGSGPLTVWQNHSSSCSVVERFRLVKTNCLFKVPIPQPPTFTPTTPLCHGGGINGLCSSREKMDDALWSGWAKPGETVKVAGGGHHKGTRKDTKWLSFSFVASIIKIGFLWKRVSNQLVVPQNCRLKVQRLILDESVIVATALANCFCGFSLIWKITNWFEKKNFLEK